MRTLRNLECPTHHAVYHAARPDKAAVPSGMASQSAVKHVPERFSLHTHTHTHTHTNDSNTSDTKPVIHSQQPWFTTKVTKLGRFDNVYGDNWPCCQGSRAETATYQLPIGTSTKPPD